jgi:hypothetical protein
MKLSPVPPQVATIGLRILKTICTDSTHESLSSLQKDFIAGVQRHILKSEINVDQLKLLTPSELTGLEIEGEFCNRMIRGGIIAACIDGEMSLEAIRKLQMFAEVLKVDLAPIETARKLAQHNLILARFDIVRRSLPGVKIKQTIQNAGIAAMVRQFLPMFGAESSELTKRYEALRIYPQGSLGRAFIDYLDQNRFPMPGQKGAGPEIIVVHDCLHILGDYGTNAAEEIEIASFQAGCQFDDPVYALLFGLAQYHLDIQMAPVAPSQAMQANPEKLLAAFVRGCQVNRDMWRDFNPWEHFSKQVEDLRRQFNVLPKN